MKLQEFIEKLRSIECIYGGDLPVKTFDLDRDICDVSEVEICGGSGQEYIYIGS